MLTTIVVPVYNSELTLDPLFERIDSVFREIGVDFEAIFIDDGSADNSWDILQKLQRMHPDKVTAIRLMRNFGQHNALMCGFRSAKGEIVVTMDDDLQNPPEEIPKLLACINEQDIDLVYGYAERKQHNIWRNLGTRVIRYFYRKVFENSVNTTSFRAIRRELLQNILTYDLNYTYIDGLLAWNTQKIAQVVVGHDPRTSGESGYTLSKLFFLALNLFTNFSILPLQIASGLGGLAAFGGFLVGIYYLIDALVFGAVVPGFASTITAVLMLGGVQLLAIGMIGEYVGRMHLNVNRRPQYAVREIVSAEARDSIGSAEKDPDMQPNRSPADR